MVLGKTLHLELPRRVVVFYLLFCLAIVIWLTVGAVLVARTVIRLRSENFSLSQLSRVSSRFEISHLRYGTENLQAVAERCRDDADLAYCAVVSPDGYFLAHSTSERVGTRAEEPDGERGRWGEIESVDFVNGTGRSLREYRIPLKNDSAVFATLRVAIPEPDAIGMIMSTAEFIPLTFIGPLALLAVGAVVLQRIVRPLAHVDAQLCQLAVSPSLDQVALRKVRVRGPGSLGWNRLVSELESGSYRSGLHERIGEALESRLRNRSNDMLNSLPDGLAATDESGVLTFANHAFLAFIGRSPQEGLPPGCAVEDSLDLREISPDSPLLRPDLTGRNIVTEVRRKTAGGERILRLARFPIRGEDPEGRRGHVWTVRDITQQKLADKMRDEFLDSATHELRTPLANIKAYAETLTLSDVLEVEQQKEFCNTINAEATRLARLIDDLLSVSSMEAGSLSIMRKKIEVDRLLREVSGKVRGQMDQKNITFETALSEKLPELELDKDKFTTALVNLLGNATKYTPKEGRVALKAKVIDSHLIIEIEDSGIGISSQELPQIFAKFFRSSDDRVRTVTGTGLGLSLAHEIIRLHGGTLTAKSELNKGSTFTIALPV